MIEMKNTYIWRIVPLNLPSVIRNCPKCGNNHDYECSQNFRVNANQNLIDVWMIYQCKKCKSTWNMEILSRVNPNQISKDLYRKFLDNDKDLARQYAFDVSTHHKNKSFLSYNSLTYDIISDTPTLPTLTDELRLIIMCEYPIDIRLDKILSQMLSVSRERIRTLYKDGCITSEDTLDIKKAKIKNGMMLYIHP